MIVPLKHILLFLIAGSRGGFTRARIINCINKTPMNTHKISKELKLDYKTVQYHLKILEENNLIKSIEKGKYGAMYLISEELEQNYEDFEKIWERFGK